MTSTRYIQILLIITFTSEAVWRSCEPGEEFKSYNLKCDLQGDLNNEVLLKADDNNIASCSVQRTPNCYTYNMNLYETSLTDKTITLNILNATRSTESNYSCCITGPDCSQCVFKIYAKPENVSCQVSSSPTNNVTVTCNVTKIYPSANCQFYWYRNGTEMGLLEKYIIYSNMSGQGQPVYFYQTCTLTQPAQNLGLGSHAFKVMAYPNITGNPSDVTYGVNSSQTPNVTINYPMIQTESCPPGYVQDGSSFNCSCRETANSFLSATVTFTQGTLVDSSGPGFVTYTFTANRSNIQDLTCKASLLNWTSSITYKPKVAYGPKNVTVNVANLTKSGDINLCDKLQPVMVTVTCVVEGNDPSPGVNFEFTINGSRTASNPVNGSSLTFGVANSGNLSFGCIGNNSALQQITARSAELHVQVIEPPASPPVIENDPNIGSPVKDCLTVQEGNTMIMCRADGGYPPVASVSVDCGGLTNTSKGNVAFLDVAVNRSMDASNCSCIATHSSTCYWKNNTVINLNVQFAPKIISLTLNESESQGEVDSNSSLSISCKAEGNPIPSLTLSKDGNQLIAYNDSQQKFTLNWIFKKTHSDCRDAGVYSCQARTDNAVTSTSLLNVTVRCQPQLDDPSLLNKVYKVKANGTLPINVTVYGYPEPNLTLTSNRKTLQNETDYTLKYTRERPSYGVVSLQIYTRTNIYQNYSLNITNSLGTLVFSFQIQEEVSGAPPTDGTDSHVGAIVGGVVGGILAIVLVVLIGIFLKKRGTFDRKTPAASATRLPNDDGSDEHQVVFDNTELYTSSQKLNEDVFDNKDLYNLNHTPDEVVFDNKDLYNSNYTPDEVVFDNSDLYNFNRNADPVNTGKDPKYRSYSDITPTMTSASAMPGNTTLNKPQAQSSPYEDVNLNEMSSKNNVKPKPASKPKPIPKPKPGDKGDPHDVKGTPADQVYATVVKVSKASKPFVCKETSPPSSPQPEIPNKMFEKFDKNSFNSKKRASHGNQDSSTCTNNGFSDLEDDINVYSNTDQ